MKVCISTFYNITHPGAVLQAYALCRKLNEMGHDARLIKYPERDAVERKFRLTPGDIYTRLIRKAERVDGYARFVAAHCPETDRGYRTIDELRQDPPEADAYICGSDQIWNPTLTAGQPDPSYFLDYGDDTVRRISYAASCGGAELSESHQSVIKGWINRFDSLSAREQGVVDLIRTLTGKDVPLVQDPTLLVDDWRSVAKPLKPKGSYVLLYQLQKSPQVYATAKAVAARLGKPLLNIDASPKFWSRPGKCVRPQSPQEWLGLFQNAAAVVTNSFHGTVFSVLFHTPFYCVSLIGEKAHRSERMRTLCDRVGLSNRHIDGDTSLPFDSVDWDAVDSKLDQLRTASLDYLERALSN